MIDKLMQYGLPLVADLVINKGEDYVKDMIGVDVDFNNDDTISKLESLEDDLAFQKEVNRHAERVIELENEDMQDAREMGKVLLQSEDTFISRFIPIFSLLSIFLGMSYLGAVSFLEIPEKNEAIVYTITGAVLTYILGQIFGYWFGTSNSSAKKDKAIINERFN